MTKKQRRAVYYTKEKARLFNLLNDFMTSEEFHKNDPVWQRAVELGRDKHLPLGEAMKIAKQKFSET